MSTILQLTRKLVEPPSVLALAGIELRNFEGPDDIEIWLDVRRRAFAREKLGVGSWDASDFDREFLKKSWWRPQVMWFAETRPLKLPPSVVGTVTLARRGEGSLARPVVHWLTVLPSYRSRGIGHLLMANLEAAVWEAGGRQVWLETHIAWTKAARLYESLGYRPTEE
jgi:GNAT superfamily N-acetyltransferase